MPRANYDDLFVEIVLEMLQGQNSSSELFKQEKELRRVQLQYRIF